MQGARNTILQQSQTRQGDEPQVYPGGLVRGRRQATYSVGPRSIQEAEPETGTPTTEPREGAKGTGLPLNRALGPWAGVAGAGQGN